MAITILYADLRTKPSTLKKWVIAWRPNLTAYAAIARTLGTSIAQQIMHDLTHDDQDLIVSWYNLHNDDICEIGRVGTLDWPIDDTTILTITYENNGTASEQISEFEDWILANEPKISDFEGN